MKKSLQQLVHSICTHGDALQADALALTAMAKGMPYADFRNKVAKAIGAKYDVAPHKSQLKRWLTFDKDSAAEQKLSAIMRLHPGKERSKTEPVVIPAGLRRSIIDSIVASGITKAQFDALLREVRESIDFK